MKKISILAMLMIILSGIAAGCGLAQSVDDINVDGADWWTTRDFVYLDWNTPEGTKSLLAGVYEDDGVVILAPYQDNYEPFPECKPLEGIHDSDFVKDNMIMKDLNSDGYDDLCIGDQINETRVSSVFIYNPDKNSFDYADEFQAEKGEGQVAANEKAADFGKFAGEWYVDGSLNNGHIEIEENGNVTSYSYEGTVNYEGEIKCEKFENPDGSKDVIYNVYDGKEIVFGFYEPEEEDFYEFYTGQDGEVHYVRKDHCTEGEEKDN